jgi:hypothetical protein
LQFVQAGIQAILRQEGLVVALLDQLALLEYENAIDIANG